MKTRRILRNTTLVLFVGLAMVSCLKDDDSLRADADVYIINKMVDGMPKTALAYFAFANQDMSSVSVAIPNSGGTVQLESYPDAVFTFAKEPADADFSTNAPADGNYVFTIESSKGDVVQLTDIVSSDNLMIPTLTDAEYDNTANRLDLSWTSVQDADGYVVKILNADRELVFNGYSVESNVTDYSITLSSASGYWHESAVNGETYYLQVQAFSYDSDANSSNYVYNLEEISIGEVEITWGTN